MDFSGSLAESAIASSSSSQQTASTSSTAAPFPSASTSTNTKTSMIANTSVVPAATGAGTSAQATSMSTGTGTSAGSLPTIPNIQLQLARRPKIDYDQQSRPITLISNHLRVNVDPRVSELHLLQLTFNPFLEVDNRILREKILASCKHHLAEALGQNFIINGANIYSVQRPSFSGEKHIKTSFHKKEYTVILTTKMAYRIDELQNENSKKSSVPLKFFTLLSQNIIKGKGFNEFGGGLSHFFEANQSDYHYKLSGTNLVLYKGWHTPIENYRDGLFVKLRETAILAGSENALSVLNAIYRDNPSLSREEKRKLVTSRFINSTVMVTYGTFSRARVLDVTFDKNVKEIKLIDQVFGPEDPRYPIEDTSSSMQQSLLAQLSTQTSASTSIVSQQSSHRSPFLALPPQTTLYDYYFQRYGLRIQFEKQPLFLVYQKRIKRFIYLIPEFCKLTRSITQASSTRNDSLLVNESNDTNIKGNNNHLSEELNEFQQQELYETLRSNPKDMYARLVAFTNRITSSQLNFTQAITTESAANSLGVQISSEPLTIKAKQIAFPTLSFGLKKDSRVTIEDASATNFNLKHPVYSSNSSYLQIAVLHFKEFSPSELIANWCTAQKDLKIDLKKPIEFNLGEFNSSKAMQEIETIVRREIKKEKFDIVAIILPSKFCSISTNYSKIKKLCTLQQQVKSQIIRTSSLENSKTLFTISSMILSQMAAKCGATLWIATPPNGGVPDKTMIIGISIQNVLINGVPQHSVGFVATQDKHLSKFYSRAVLQKIAKDDQSMQLHHNFQQHSRANVRSSFTIEKLRTLILEAIRAYFAQNKYVPENIIFLRESIPEDMVAEYLQNEVKDILQSFTELSPQYKPKLCVTLIDTSRHGVRCFTESEHANAPSGTVIDSTITNRNQYDFYLVASNPKQGTATPVHYRILYDSTGFPEGKFQELIYSQCFNYANCAGAIRIPAQIQYARKLATMVGTYLQEEVSEKFYSSKFFL